MNWDVIEGNWDQFKGVLRQKWGKLTDQDMEVIKGKKDELMGAIHEKLGLKKEEFRTEFDRVSDSFIKKVRQSKAESVIH